jgi:hypothetical protein
MFFAGGLTLEAVTAFATARLWMRPGTLDDPHDAFSWRTAVAATLLTAVAAAPSWAFLLLTLLRPVPVDGRVSLARLVRYWVAVGPPLIFVSYLVLPWRRRRPAIEVARICHVLLWALVSLLSLVAACVDGPIP